MTSLTAHRADDTAWSAVPTLSNRDVRLAPLQAAHADALRAAAADGELWRLHYTSVPGPQAGEAETYIATALAQRDAGLAWPFAVFDASGALVGSTRYYDIDRTVPKLKIGYTWYAVRAQRTGVNTEAKRLLLAYAFQRLGCASVFFETSHLNLRSQAAIARLGAQRDGVLRGHMRHRDGSLRDTVVFSILAEEWSRIDIALAAKLARHAEAIKDE
jgi:RimJ/RimL family protein N-acetyltransferase